MKNSINNVLISREERSHYIASLLKEGKVVVSLKANIPGENKQCKEAYLLVRIFNEKLKFLPILQKQYVDSSDGPYLLYVLDETDAFKIKRQMVEIEETSDLGRLIDLDVYQDSMQSIRRNGLRKCLLCDQAAFVCARNGNHSIQELLDKEKAIIDDYLKDLLTRVIDDSILTELNLDPKFGLVTPFTSGSHPDMDYSLMKQAKDVIIPFFLQMFQVGYEETNLKEIFQQIREIGKRAEKAMLDATAGINAYKGLIFNLGLVVASTGYCLSRNLKIEESFKIVSLMTRGITAELKQNPTTFGIKAFQNHQFGGARKEAESGLPTVQAVLPLLHTFSKEELLKVLIEIIKRCEDTVLLNRANTMEKYQMYKNLFKSISTINLDELKIITDICIKDQVSFGGSADLLIVSVFLAKLKSYFH